MSYYDPFDDSGYDETATLEEESPRERRRRRGGPVGLYNLLSIIFFLGALAAVAVTVLIFRSPEPIALVQPQPTATLIPFPFLTPGNDSPTPTFETQNTGGLESTATETSESTSQPAATATELVDSGNPTSTPSLFPFTLVDNAITYEANQNEAGCDWSGIAGRVIDVNDDAVDGLPIQVTGPDDFEALVFSGTAPEYGPGGFEIGVADEPVEAEYRLQLLNTTGQAFSEPIIVRTLATCERNVAIAVFQQSENFEAP